MLASSFDALLGLPLDATTTLRHTSREGGIWRANAKILGITTSKYIRAEMADAAVKGKLIQSIERENTRKQNALILQALGKSRIANNLNQLAYAAHVEGLNLEDPSVVAQIHEAYEAVMTIRSLLIQSSGVSAL
ncbi:hypothetical protein EYS14_13525 [Alteromonadaceae bacterium M269]|nr:hypothetical protein EYS14_13525 [Alteromonadaceae bacterium M269]